MVNVLRCQLDHPLFRKNKIELFVTQIDNCVVTFKGNSDLFEMVITGKNKQKKMMSLTFDIFSLVWIYIGGFPKIKSITYNSKIIDFSGIVGKYRTDMYFQKPILCIINLSEDYISQVVMDRYRSLAKMPLYSMQYLISEDYKHVIVNHKITLLLHTIDGLVDDSVVTCSAKDIKDKYHVKDYLGKYLPKVYYLCNNYFFKFHRKYNCEILSLLSVNQFEFLKVITDTRNAYSHFLADEKKQHRLTKGVEMIIYFEIVLYALRIYLIEEKLHRAVDENNIREYYYIIHDWILDVQNNTSKPVKSKTYKINKGIREMELAFKQLQENTRQKV